jgi:hypothetical protein
MNRINAWIEAKPHRFQLILLGHTAVFACAILIAAGLFRPHDHERTLVDAHGLADRPTSRTTETRALIAMVVEA